MSKPQILIHPEEVNWKYFYWDQETESVQCCHNENQVPSFIEKDGREINRNKVAILTTALFFADTPTQTPDIIKRVVESALNNEGRPSRFCIALPYKENYEEYYGIDESKKSHYSNIIAHDNFNPVRKVAYMSPKAGAAQIASAIEHGFHIHAMAGGVQAESKQEFVRDYFRAKPLPENHPRRIFAGFSNNSENQFGLRELVEYVHTRNAGRTFLPESNKERFPEKTREIIEIFEEQNDHNLPRILNCEDNAIYNEIKSRYQEGDRVRFHTYFPRQLISTIDSPYRPNFSGEKLILGLEGYLQCETGYNTSEALEIALQSGAIDPNQVIAIVIENIIIPDDEMSVRRVDGYIPEYKMLETLEKDKILEIMKKIKKLTEVNVKQEEDLIREYIICANNAYNEELARIREVAKNHGVPIILGGKVRAGHAKNYVIQPNCVTDIHFDDNPQTLEINSIIRRNEPVIEIPTKVSPNFINPKIWQESLLPPVSQEQKDFVASLGRTVNYPYSKTSFLAAAQNNEFISTLKIEAANEIGEDFLNDERNIEFDVVAGVSGNISERSLSELNGKGLICIMPRRVDASANADHAKLHNSGRLGASDIIDPNPEYRIPFVILAAQDPEIQNGIVLKPMLKDFNPQLPVFLATNLAKILPQELPSLFETRINIREMANSIVETTAIRPNEASRLSLPEINLQKS
ncbi:MAG: hypothetical protein V4694_00505 [Pseudomonadota bacterium]